MLTSGRLALNKGVLLLSLLVMAFVGCVNKTAQLDASERCEPLMQRAQDKVRDGNIDDAIKVYRGIIDENPDMAVAHLDIAFLMHDYLDKKDYVGAIYHYRRYLELRPYTEKKEMITSRIRLASQLFAASILPRDTRAAEEIAGLAKENTALKAELIKLKTAVNSNAFNMVGSVSKKDSDVSIIKERSSGEPEPEKRIKSYRVKRGDTLSGIAISVYGDVNQKDKIFAANKGVIKDPDKLSVDQVLIIP